MQRGVLGIKVFNPIFHPDLIITSGEGTSLLGQLRDYGAGNIVGSILLLIIAGVVAWVITRKWNENLIGLQFSWF